jgi:parallel beta-helix repeat protein
MAANRVTGLAIWGNNVSTATNAGVYISTSHESIVDHCHIGENDHSLGYGVYLYGTTTGDCDNNMVSDNSIQRIRLTGIRGVGTPLVASFEENIISNNLISYCGLSGTGGNGISITGSRNTIIGNTIEESFESGIVIDGPHNAIVGNTSCENNNNGIIIFSGDLNTVTGNVCKENDNQGTGNFAGIWLNTDYNTVTGNVCYNNVKCGILVAATANHNIISSNQLFGNGLAGLEDLATNTHKNSNFTETSALSGNKIRIRRQQLPLTINQSVDTLALSTTAATTWDVGSDVVVPFNAVGIILDVQVRDSGAGSVDCHFKLNQKDSTGYVTVARCPPGDDRYNEREMTLLFKQSFDTPVGSGVYDRVSNIVTVTSNAHGLVVGDVVEIVGADQVRYNGVHSVSAVTINTFDYKMSISVFAGQNTTPATGVITWARRLNELNYTIQASGAGTFDLNMKIVGWVLDE